MPAAKAILYLTVWFKQVAFSVQLHPHLFSAQTLLHHRKDPNVHLASTPPPRARLPTTRPGSPGMGVHNLSGHTDGKLLMAG